MKHTIVLFTFFLLIMSALDTSAQTPGRRVVKHSYYNQSNNNSAQKRKPSIDDANTSPTKNDKKNTGKRRSIYMQRKTQHNVEGEFRPTSEDYFQWGEKDYEAGNYSNAKEWYELAANEGHTESQYYLGYMYEKGEGCARDYNKALEWYLKAIEKKHAKAARRAGWLFYDGEGFSINYKTAFNLFSKAAEWGDANAQCILGYMYANGQGVASNAAKALEWYDAAAPDIIHKAKSAMDENGEFAIGNFNVVTSGCSNRYAGPALCYIGYIYYHGKGGIVQNYEEATKYFRQAEEKGSKSAAYYLGMCYEFGKGIIANDNFAEKYYDKSGYKTITEADRYMDCLTGIN